MAPWYTCVANYAIAASSIAMALSDQVIPSVHPLPSCTLCLARSLWPGNAQRGPSAQAMPSEFPLPRRCLACSLCPGDAQCVPSAQAMPSVFPLPRQCLACSLCPDDAQRASSAKAMPSVLPLDCLMKGQTYFTWPALGYRQSSLFTTDLIWVRIGEKL